MGRIARNELYYGRQRKTEDVLKQVMAVTTDDLQRVANHMFYASLMNLAIVGPFTDNAESLQIDVG
jgi:predicted Zn-dependent peptidase